ncbi:hypothetical protein KZZ52_33350 [Dactylosporangium sp. AC04546]|uniref:hypothetical protein n=1 Tax=Dactylosporangium sp. AC04546 TaxID=2862460 RepID=UPI001EDD78B6|nr:hypothetical protein [Dactylosporangium sp. AC04546]WVK78868.1 hypothetical protein KZZ52_33350 [Dactylosporangium sp. AC04546]
MRPILLNSCARAATAAEARFRLDAPIAPSRGTRVVALDEGAEAVVRRAAEQHRGGAHFLSCQSPAMPADGDLTGIADVVLVRDDGSEARLSAELAGADAAVMVATTDEAAAAARAIGDACTLYGIMTAGLVLAGQDTRVTVSALRPHARVLMVTHDEQDLTELLTALRA